MMIIIIIYNQVGAVLAKLDKLVVLDPGQISLQFNLVRELILDRLLHLSLDLAAFLLTLLDQLRHAIVGLHKDFNATLKQLSLRLLVPALVSLPLEFELEPLYLAH